MKLSLINQILNVDNHILAISPSKLITFGFYEVMKCYFETPSPLPCFSSFVNDENLKKLIIVTYFRHHACTGQMFCLQRRYRKV